MSKGLNYSKWDHIEVSDDEDDTHPNIDTPSLFRWRHQARVERMDASEKEKDDFTNGYSEFKKKLNAVEDKFKAAKAEGAAGLPDLEAEYNDLLEEAKTWKAKEDEIKKKERLTPLNVDTLSKDKWGKTVINPGPQKAKNEKLSDEEVAQRYKTFMEKNRENIKTFGMFRKYEDSRQFLADSPELVCEDTASYLTVWCIDLEVEEKHDLMGHVAHQTIVMQFILELAKQLDYDPRSCVRPFFSRIQTTDKQYKDAFNDELESFKDRVRTRAKARIDAAMKEYEEEEKKKRLGPGGLDPVEVFEALPPELQRCFEDRNIPLLQEVLAKLDPKEAKYHIDRCVKSGMWVPEGHKEENDDEAGTQGEAMAEGEEAMTEGGDAAEAGATGTD